MQPNDINLVDTSGQSSLHLACHSHSVQLVDILLSHPRYKIYMYFEVWCSCNLCFLYAGDKCYMHGLFLGACALCSSLSFTDAHMLKGEAVTILVFPLATISHSIDSAWSSRDMCILNLQYLGCATCELQPIVIWLPGVRLPLDNM